MAQDSIIKIINLEKTYKVDEKSEHTLVLSDVNLEIQAKDFVIIYGPSGSGKSTLLHHIVGLESPTKGQIIVRDVDITKMTQEERAIFRAQKFGMVYQLWYWAKSLSVWENVALPLLIVGASLSQAKRRAREVLSDIDMLAYADKKPMQLSGGEQQRIGLARALVNNPWILVADEPTGNLDTKNADDVMKILVDLNKNHGRTIIMVTHNLAYLPLATKTVAIKDGRIVSSDAAGVRSEIRKELKEIL